MEIFKTKACITLNNPGPDGRVPRTPDLKNTIRRMTLFIYVDNQVIQAFRLLKRWKSIQFMIDLTSKTVIYEKVSQFSFREFNPSKIQLRL